MKNTDFVFGEKHREYMKRALKTTVNIAEGSVRAGKTVDNVFVFAALLEMSKDKFHLATGSTLGNAKLNIGDCNGLGLERIFRGRCSWGRYRDNECMKIHTRSGEKIVIFSGGKNSDSFKKIRGNSYGMWIATEINLHEESFIMEAMNRQLAAQDRRIFWDLNPTSPDSWIYKKYIDRYREDEKMCTYGHFTIRDNPVITEERLKEIESQYDKNSLWYKRDILGMRCASEGAVYPTYASDPERYKMNEKNIQLEFINIGVDFGGHKSKTAFCAVGFGADERGTLYALSDCEIGGEKNMTDSESVNNALIMFISEIESRYPHVPIRYIFCDSEAQYLICGIKKRLGTRYKVSDCAKKRICDRIAFENSLLAQDRIKITPECEHLSSALSMAEWDGDMNRKDDFTSDIDILDAFEYAIERYMKWKMK